MAGTNVTNFGPVLDKLVASLNQLVTNLPDQLQVLITSDDNIFQLIQALINSIGDLSTKQDLLLSQQATMIQLLKLISGSVDVPTQVTGDPRSKTTVKQPLPVN